MRTKCNFLTPSLSAPLAYLGSSMVAGFGALRIDKGYLCVLKHGSLAQYSMRTFQILNIYLRDQDDGKRDIV